MAFDRSTNACVLSRWNGYPEGLSTGQRSVALPRQSRANHARPCSVSICKMFCQSRSTSLKLHTPGRQRRVKAEDTEGVRALDKLTVFDDRYYSTVIPR